MRLMRPPWRKAAEQFPDDDDIAVLYAESVMDVSPWNYWQPGGKTRRRKRPDRADIGARACQKSGPSRRNALLHSRGRGLGSAAARGALCGSAARRDSGRRHLVHMPSHIYYRVGRYLDAFADNKIGGRRSMRNI